MDAGDIAYACRDIAERLFVEFEAKRITRVDVETVRAACAGFVADLAVHGQTFEDLVECTLRRFVQKCA
jgi:hypothetical protein